MWKPLVFILTSFTVHMSEAYRILLISQTLSKSHAILAEGLIKHLTDAGHEITYIQTIPPEKPLPRVTVVDISGILPRRDDFFHTKSIFEKRLNSLNLMTGFMPDILQRSRLIIEHPNIQKLIADNNQHFDVVISEFMFNTIHAGFAGLYNCPLIWFSPSNLNWMVFDLIDEATNPAYSVDAVSSSTLPLTFRERVAELGLHIIKRIVVMLWTTIVDNAVYEKNFAPLIRERRNIAPSFESLAYNGSLVLSNSHPSMSGAVRAPQNFISIGGFHIDRNVKPLTEDLQKLMDDAKHGVIYFSLGSNLKSKHLPNEIKRDLLSMFGKLKQTVVWKFEEDLPERPTNVHTVPWAPQQSILAHNNCILFITHGGLLSITETIHFGVPIIGIPAFYDQYANVQRAVNMGYAKKVDLSYAMTQDLEFAIQDMLADSKYTTRAKELSEIYHDRTVPPEKELVHWVEHVIKTRGAPHLRSPAFIMPWYQKFYLDLAFVALVLIFILKKTLLITIGIKKTIGKQKKT
ncbi:UDP-glucosyltransferase 2-like [Bicyclus anynana]|uniref:UDP-glucuronosyltransferase n=1 Tax=Bicyclus anynana TaxID=110368 RepID=A0A6J1P112_BICAN|nr:UDP-glucosyltransferase 2-like [Bicyclus anynana]